MDFGGFGICRTYSMPTFASFRDVFRRDGHNWHWFSRLHMSDKELASFVHHPAPGVYSLQVGDCSFKPVNDGAGGTMITNPPVSSGVGIAAPH
jgi:hypothetical protein